MEKRKIIKWIIVIIVALLVICLIGFIGFKNKDDNKLEIELSKAFDIENLEQSNLPILKSKKEEIAPLYKSVLSEDGERSLYVVDAYATIDNMRGKVYYVRKEGYNINANIFQVGFKVKNKQDIEQRIEEFTEMSKKILNLSDKIKIQNNLINAKEIKGSLAENLYEKDVICNSLFGTEEKLKTEEKKEEKTNNQNKKEKKDTEESKSSLDKILEQADLSLENAHQADSSAKHDENVKLKIDERYNMNFYLKSGKLICELVKLI